MLMLNILNDNSGVLKYKPERNNCQSAPEL